MLSMEELLRRQHVEIEAFKCMFDEASCLIRYVKHNVKGDDSIHERAAEWLLKWRKEL